MVVEIFQNAVPHRSFDILVRMAGDWAVSFRSGQVCLVRYPRSRCIVLLEVIHNLHVRKLFQGSYFSPIGLHAMLSL